MTDTIPDAPVPAAEEVTEATRDVLLDLFLEHWPRIAATAWEGFLARGRGTVLVEDGACWPALAYQSGSPCPCHTELVASYEPEQQAVVAVVAHGRKIASIIALGGWPTPPDAYATALAGVFGAPTH